MYRKYRINYIVMVMISTVRGDMMSSKYTNTKKKMAALGLKKNENGDSHCHHLFFGHTHRHPRRNCGKLAHHGIPH